MRVVKIDKATDEVVNIELWDGLPEETEEFVWVEHETAGFTWTWDGEELIAPLPPPFEMPAEIAMHKVRKALKQLGPSGTITPETYEDSWWMRTLAVIESLTNPIQRDSILDELNTAPNMVVAGSTTQMVRMAVGMSDEQLEDVALLALTLP